MSDKSRYFSHDYNARRDTKLLKARTYFRKKYGHSAIAEPYSIFFQLVEILAENMGFFSYEDIETLIEDLYGSELPPAEFKLAEEKINWMIFDSQLFQLNNDRKIFWSNRLNTALQRSLSTVVVNRRNGLISAKNRKQARYAISRNSHERERLKIEIEQLEKQIEDIDSQLKQFDDVEPSTTVERPLTNRQPINKINKINKQSLPTVVDLPKKEDFGEEFDWKKVLKNQVQEVWVAEIFDKISISPQKEVLMPQFSDYVQFYVVRKRPTSSKFCSWEHFLAVSEDNSFQDLIKSLKTA